MNRVLHIGNTSGVSNHTAEYARKHGIKCDVMIFYPDVLKHGCDIDYGVTSKFIRCCMPVYSGYRIIKMLKHIKNYDILHFHAFGGITFYMDFPFWKLLGKKIILHYHGTELRRFKNESPFAHLADKKYCSTPDLIQYGKNIIWVPTPLILDDYTYVGIDESKKDKLIVLNATGSYEHGIKHKGTNIIHQAIQLTKDRGYNFEYRQLYGVSHKEAIKQYAEADIIIGQTKIGWYGKFEQECMALGKPVITYLDEYIIKLANIKDNIPIVNCGKDDPYRLSNKLTMVLTNANLRKQLSIQSRRYIEKYHDESPLNILINTYKEL